MHPYFKHRFVYEMLVSSLDVAEKIKMPGLSSGNARFSDSVPSLHVIEAYKNAMRAANGSGSEAMTDSILQKAASNQQQMNDAVAARFPTANDVNLASNDPGWYSDALSALFTLKEQAATTGYQHGFVVAYPSAFLEGFKIGMDADDFSPPVTLTSGCRRFLELIGPEEVLSHLNSSRQMFMDRMAVDEVSQETGGDSRHQLGYSLRMECLLLGFLHGYCAAFGTGISDSFRPGAAFRADLENIVPRP